MSKIDELIEKFKQENPQYKEIMFDGTYVCVKFYDNYDPNEWFSLSEFVPGSKAYDLLEKLNDDLHRLRRCEKRAATRRMRRHGLCSDKK